MGTTRRKTRAVTVGNVVIGGDAPISVQSMAKTRTGDVAATVEEIKKLEKAGCEIVRVSVKDLEDARAIQDIKKETSLPMVADIHFDYKLALESIKSGVDKIRINPGNITKEDEIAKVIEASSIAGIPIRIGANSGSLKEGLSSSDMASKMVRSVIEYLEHFKEKDFNDIVISLKASDVPTTVQAYRKLAGICDYPLHLGVTAAGLFTDGIIRSSIGIGALLVDGIGDTLRVSLTEKAVSEIDIARKILSFSGVRNFGPEIRSCPTCGRCQVDLVSIVKELDEKLKQEAKKQRGKRQGTDKQLIIAVMGCEVNGPGEAKEADIGIAFGQNKGAIFKRGTIVKTVKSDSAIKELLEMIKEHQSTGAPEHQ